MLNKDSKIRLIENFYALDYILFGKPITEIETCCPVLIEEYISTKGAVISTLKEMFEIIHHKAVPIKNPEKKITEKVIRESAEKAAKIAKTNVSKLMENDRIKSDFKKSINKIVTENKKINVDKLIEEKILEQSLKLAIDNILIGRSLRECSKCNEIKSIKGKLVSDAYNFLRDSLIDSALTIVKNS